MTAVARDGARTTTRSAEIMARAREVFPGGVSSPVRAFGGVGGEPFVVARGAGARIWDADDNEYLDYVLSWGPLVLGLWKYHKLRFSCINHRDCFEIPSPKSQQA